MTIKELIKVLSELEHQELNIVLPTDDGFIQPAIEEFIHYGDSSSPEPQHHYEFIPDYEDEADDYVECDKSPVVAKFMYN
jgi:hypothetical protein